jgi:ribosomal protein S4
MIHKIKPTLRTYRKLDLAPSSKKKHSFFSPDFSYLSSRFRSKIQYIFATSLKNTNRFNLNWGFHKKSYLKKGVEKIAPLSRHLKEIEFCSNLERRLDILLFRSGLASSLFEAKQLISHKKIKVNNHYVSCFSILLEKGDVISFTPSIKLKIKTNLTNQIKTRTFFFTNFSHLEINWQNLKIIVLLTKVALRKHLHFHPFLFDWKALLYK